MTLLIVLEDEKGNQLDRIVDSSSELMKLINREVDEKSCCLRFIDPYGNTVFNRLQAPILVEELDQLSSAQIDGEVHKLLVQIVDLTAESMNEPHRYIKIYGD